MGEAEVVELGRKFYSTKEVAEMLGGVSKWTVLNWINEGVSRQGQVHKLQAVNVGKSEERPVYKIPALEVRRFSRLLGDSALFADPGETA